MQFQSSCFAGRLRSLNLRFWKNENTASAETEKFFFLRVRNFGKTNEDFFGGRVILKKQRMTRSSKMQKLLRRRCAKMACFYFRLKTDKKPNGMRISSASHVSYVNREGRFRNIDNVQEMGQNKSYKNFLSGDHPIMKLPEKPMLLYSSPRIICFVRKTTSPCLRKNLLKQSLLMLQYSLKNCDQGYVLLLQQRHKVTALKA